jgi:hypothetical protein
MDWRGDMALTNAYVLPISRIPELFRKIQDGQAPERLTTQLLRDWGFSSTNDRAFIPLLKALNFLTADGKPTERYLLYRDHSKSKTVLGQAVREAYSDIFLIKERPTNSDREAVEGKFKSYHNVSDNVANLMAKTFFGLLPLAELAPKELVHATTEVLPKVEKEKEIRDDSRKGMNPQLHYNIQIHLPATKDIEVLNAIFKSLKEHLIE